MYPQQHIDKAEQLVACLNAQQRTITMAESCTGGLLGGLVTSVAGASNIFHQGFVTYSNSVKTQALNVPPGLLTQHGAVSQQVAEAMATGALKAANAQISLAITGIAGPGGGSADKPVGLVYMACATAQSVISRKHLFSGDRQEVRLAACEKAIDLALECV